MAEATQIAVAAALSGVALALLIAVARGPLASRPRLAGTLAAGLAAASVASYYGFGRFHGRDVRLPGYRFVHYYENFHYQLGSKYFPELGYDGLYAASLAAERERFPERPTPPRTRDLRTNRVVPTARLQPQMERVKGRFEPARWRAFVDDYALFARMNPPSEIERWRLDLGYNPTPAWTAVARLLNANLPLTHRRLQALAALDVLLLGVAFVAVFRSFGPAAGLASLVAFGVGYPGRFTWVGGAYLRQDWLAAVVLAICALKRGRTATAGALIGYASAVRIFPVLFLLGPALCALRDLWRGERPGWALRLAAGFTAALAVAFLAGSLSGRGASAWSEFGHRIEIYRTSGARNLIGLEGPVLFGPEIARRALSAEPDAHWNLQVEEILLRRQLLRPWLLAAQLLLLGLLAAAAWRAPPAEAAVLSLAAVFTLTPAAGYYWLALLLIPLRRAGAAALAAALLANLAMCAAHAASGDTLVRYGLVSAALAAFWVAWLLPDALRSAREGVGRLVAARASG